MVKKKHTSIQLQEPTRSQDKWPRQHRLENQDFGEVKKLQKAPIQSQYFQKGHIEVFFPKPKAQRLSLNFNNLGSQQRNFIRLKIGINQNFPLDPLSFLHNTQHAQTLTSCYEDCVFVIILYQYIWGYGIIFTIKFQKRIAA